MADELGISKSAYSKIETGSTDPSVKRMQAIAKILDVDVTYFFQDSNKQIFKAEDQTRVYGYATRADIEELTAMITKLKQELASIKAGLKATAAKPKKK